MQRRGKGRGGGQQPGGQRPPLSSTPSIPSTSTSSTTGMGERERPPPPPPNPAAPFALIVEESVGLTVNSFHPVFPDFQFVQGELFLECTLFLYSVLALSLQYLNLYKSLWWLPKSYWHFSIKVHLINPYFLSCVGLLLGLRVTKCFWNSVSEYFRGWSDGQSPVAKGLLHFVEYGIMKMPVTGMILTSFLFSFTRILREYPTNAVIYFLFPPFLYVVLFHGTIEHRWRRFRQWLRQLVMDVPIGEAKLTFSDTWLAPDPRELEIETVAHMCSGNPSRIREEVDLILADCWLRLRRCLFAGLSTAFLAIVLPLFFVPFKTSTGQPMKMLVHDMWQLEMGVIVFATAFTHYVTYLFPLNYLDLMYRSAMHLGRWQVAPDPGSQAPSVTHSGPSLSGMFNSAPTTPIPALARRIIHAAAIPAPVPPAPLWCPAAAPYPDGMTVVDENGTKWKAVALSSKVRTVAACPGDSSHWWFAKLLAHPLKLMNVLCMAECCIIFYQFWLLVLCVEWQHIATLVLLMFANYLLLAKLFKDRVILSRVYEPSKEDLDIIKEVQQESMRRRVPGTN